MNILIINGVDFTPYVAYRGLHWKRNDMESKKAGRTTMDGKMHRARIAIKYTLQVDLIPIDQATSERLLAAIEPEFVQVTCRHPRYGEHTFTMYSNNVPTDVAEAEEDDTLWDGISFPLIEQ